MEKLPTLSGITAQVKTAFVNVFIVSIFTVSFTNAQSILSPKTLFEYACPQDSFNKFEVAVEIEPADFANDNNFFIELSDKNGDFKNPTILTVSENSNDATFFYAEFAFPDNVYGENYRIRARSTSPEFISEASTPFAAHYINNLYLTLNNYEDVTLCSEESETQIAINSAGDYTYHWFKDGEFYVAAGAEITVNEPGLYYAETFLGSCTGLAYSNVISVTEGEDETQVEVFPGLEVQLRAGDIQEFTATGSDTYKWMNEIGEIISDKSIANIDEAGIYTIEATSGNCKVTKNIVVTLIEDDALDITENDEEINALKADTKQIPSFISPNGDNVNDKWVLPESLSSDSNVEVMIFTANGTPIFETNNYQNNWPNESIASNTNAATNIVYYMIKKEGEAIGKGSITVVQ
ncbi:gliding motility-associated C-terminal domain-containing protein [Spongiivirga sp. MCCC 1A20706]|uniref:T9SS type B sorting domain-containing protein n=1 Tax=Spongiivirga sp. MCCC 1A20706 TaxID=3160963 RepID=UPI0039776CC2